MNESVTIDQPSTWRSKVGNYLGLERKVSIAAGAVFILGLGEELWKKFVPKYLEALGAGIVISSTPLRKVAAEFKNRLSFNDDAVNGRLNITWGIVF